MLVFAGVSCSSQKKGDDQGPGAVISQNNGGAAGGGTMMPNYPKGSNPNVSLTSTGGGRGISYSRVNTPAPYIAMTFDDGPHPRLTPRLLDILRERNIRATFYVVGRNAKLYPHLIQRMVAEGHEVGNHTWNHPNLTKLSDAAVHKELRTTEDAIVAACGVRPRTMRPPYGALRQSQRAMIKSQYDYPTILWDVDPQDWRRPGPAVVANRIVSKTRNGSIVLAHDIHSSTIDAMPAALDGLLSKGYTFVTVSQLLTQEP
ncbi:polysaccharide deacetylase family protein [Sulfuriroseicoccus oceanibius]|uniref:Polysaccharide deacetylase family protein n=2 Tax=Sulfuriroseicoccus oceanibius TaxID=2707525 RepID=A0A6B3L3D4_9BACT|nr:polysaccharide deacetylase family protein [Sulfuriroseicoccus oceanibius]